MDNKISDNSKCRVIGYRSWATALVHVLEKNRKEVWWHIRNEEIVKSTATGGRNVKYLSDLEFGKTFIHATPDLKEVIGNYKIILVAVPSASLSRTWSMMCLRSLLCLENSQPPPKESYQFCVQWSFGSTSVHDDMP